MRILFINYMNSSLPTMIRTLELAKATSLHGHNVTLSFMHPSFNPPPFFYDVLEAYKSGDLSIKYKPLSGHVPQRQMAGKVTECRPRMRGLIRQIIGSLRYIPAEVRLFKEVRPDVIVARPDHVISFVFTSALFRIPLVLETDGPIEEMDYYWGISSKWLRYIDLMRARSARAILYISKVCGQLWLEKRIPAERLFLCPNGADPDFFKPIPAGEREELRRKYGLEGTTVIGFSGNQRQWHGVNLLLKSVLPLLQQNPGIKVFVIGTIEDKQSLGLDDIPADVVDRQIVFTGPVNYLDMPKMIDLVDLVVMPYPYLELFHFSPMKMFEALSLGKTIVAPRMGQIADLLSNLDSAYLYDPEVDGAMLDAVTRGLEAIRADNKGCDNRKLLIQGHSWFQRGAAVSSACRYALESRTVFKGIES